MMAKWKVIDMTPLTMVEQFAVAMGQPLGLPWVTGDTDTVENMRFKLINEEFIEFSDEYKDPVAALKELADLVYVCYGYAATFGWDLDEAVKRVHTSNMSKLGDDGKPIKREDGKVQKGPNYKKPDLTDLV